MEWSLLLIIALFAVCGASYPWSGFWRAPRSNRHTAIRLPHATRTPTRRYYPSTSMRMMKNDSNEKERILADLFEFSKSADRKRVSQTQKNFIDTTLVDDDVDSHRVVDVDYNRMKKSVSSSLDQQNSDISDETAHNGKRQQPPQSPFSINKSSTHPQQHQQQQQQRKQHPLQAQGRDEIAELLFPTTPSNDEDQNSNSGDEEGDGVDDNDNEEGELTIEDEIQESINILMAIDEMGELEHLKPSFLTERSHLLCNGNKYREVYESRMKDESLTPESLARLERVNAVLSGFIQSEKKSRSRLKLNYILACILDKQILEEAIQKLSMA